MKVFKISGQAIFTIMWVMENLRVELVVREQILAEVFLRETITPTIFTILLKKKTKSVQI